MKRRSLVTGLGAVAGIGTIGVGVSFLAMNDGQGYEAAARAVREALSANPQMKDLVRYATLAANSHNTQAWKFILETSAVSIVADRKRATPVVDPDDHHLIASLGCAAENLVLAAGLSGQTADVVLDKIGGGDVLVNLSKSTTAPDPLVHAVPLRQCTRSRYDGAPISANQMQLLESAARQEGVDVAFATDQQKREQILEMILAANGVQMADRAFVAELNSWLRFNSAAAVATKDGLFSGCSGNPQMPSWIGKAMFPYVFSEASERDKIAAQMRSSPGIAVFVSQSNDAQHWFNAGRAYERFALQATALGIRNAHMNQPVEVAAQRKELASWLGMPDTRPNMVIRFGAAPAMPMSLRRNVEDVLVAEGNA